MPVSDKEILKEKIKNFFENRINNLNIKLNKDLKSIENLKYNYYDNCIKQFEKYSNLNKNNNNTDSNENTKEKTKEIEKFKKITVIKKTHRQIPSLLQKSVKVFNQTYIKLNRNIHFNSFHIDNMNKTFDKLSKKNNNIDLFKNHFNSINNKKNLNQKIFQKSKTNVSDNFSNKKIINNIFDKSCIKLPNNIIINNNIKCLYFLIEKNFINNKLKYNIIISLPTLYNIIYKKNLKFLIQNKPKEIENKIKLLENQFENILDYKIIESNKFIPSKQSINGLNYITKEQIKNFIKIEKTGLPNEIKNIFLIIIYLFDYDDTNEFKNDEILLDVHFKNILNKYNVKNIKNLFLKYIEMYPYLNITKNKFEKLNKIFNENKNILNNEEIAKINRPLSYISFILNEIYLYINKKNNNDIYFYEIINKNNEIIKLKKKLEIIKNKLK